MSMAAKKQACGIPAPDRREITSHDPDALMVLTGLARIDDPMVSYLVGMLIDRVADLIIARRLGVEPRSVPSLDVLLAAEPHGVPYSTPVTDAGKP
jgi:hypothetical protein